jgi:hypothetical protein
MKERGAVAPALHGQSNPVPIGVDATGAKAPARARRFESK